VLLNLSNRSENVMLVREMLTGVGETGDLDSSDLYDIRTAVTEACNNVVLHAYEGAEGPLQVELLASRDTIEVTVRDEGVGIRPRIRPADEAALGIGLPLIQALVHSVEFSERGGGGTAVRMEFRALSRRPLEPSGENDYPAEQLAGAVANLATTTAMTIAPASLAQAVLPRVLSVLAARALLHRPHLGCPDRRRRARRPCAQLTGRKPSEPDRRRQLAQPRAARRAARPGPRGAADRRLGHGWAGRRDREADRRSPHRRPGLGRDARSAAARPRLAA